MSTQEHVASHREEVPGGVAAERMPSLPAPGSPIIEVRDIGKSYGSVIALRDITTTVNAGEVTCVLGDNGAGKSTFIKILAGAHEHSTGEFIVDGVNRHFASPRAALALGIATVYQDLALCDNLDVVENLFLGREEIAEGPARVTRQLDETAMERQTGELLQTLAVTIIDVRSEVGTLSGGQRQQVAIARSLLGEPKLVMLDEPTAALGVRQTAQVLELIKRLRERGLAVVVISHNLADVFEVADRVFVLRLGRKAGDIAAHESSQEEVVAAITGAEFGGNGQRSNEDESTGGEG
jgi:D-xylose transport system ATP-binding protein